MKKLLSIVILASFFSFNIHVGAREVLESKKIEAWEVDGKFIVPECLIYEWYSGDNYETFYETYFKKEADHGDSNFRNFIENIGLFLNKEAPLRDLIKTAQTLSHFGPKLPSLLENLLTSDIKNKTNHKKSNVKSKLTWALIGSASTTLIIIILNHF